MDETEAREFTADLLTGRRTHINDRSRRGPGDDARETSEVLSETSATLDELARERAKDPVGVLQDFRELLDDDTMTDADLDSFIEVWRGAVDDPETFRKNVEIDDTRGPRSWLNAIRGWLHRPAEPDKKQREMLADLATRYRFPSDNADTTVNPNERVFEYADPAYVPLAKVKLGERKWPEGLTALRRHKPPQTYSYPAVGADGKPLAADAAHNVGLFADFGTGYYHSWGIAEQLAAWGFPYTFHLGDVYYAGRDKEFTERFELPLSRVVERTRLLGLAENHELYQGGTNYLEYFDNLHRRGRTPQESSYWSVQFPHHQIIGLDCNWQGRCRLRPEETAMHDWLAARLVEAGDRTVILLTGNAPFVHGHDENKPLLTDLWRHVRDGAVHMWFWGDDHYCALFDKNPPSVPFYGSCIGHGGFPGSRKRQNGQKTFGTDTVWLEDAGRFPPYHEKDGKLTHMRDDMSNNGWCQATLRPDGGVDLLYVDWLWAKRAAISFDRVGRALQRRGPAHTFDRDLHPQLHVPAGA